MSIDLATKQRAEQYAENNQLLLVDEMGSGFDGVVYSTSRTSAIKALKHQRLYQTEKQVYIRLSEVGIVEIEGFYVPTMLQFDDRLWVVEMEIVKPPFILDFAGAYLDRKPP